MVIEFLDFRSIAGTAHLSEKFPEKWKKFPEGFLSVNATEVTEYPKLGQ